MANSTHNAHNNYHDYWDNKNKRYMDRYFISISEKYEANEWSINFGVTKEQLTKACKELEKCKIYNHPVKLVANELLVHSSNYGLSKDSIDKIEKYL